MFKFCSMFYSSGKLIFSLVTLYKNVTLLSVSKELYRTVSTGLCCRDLC